MKKINWKPIVFIAILVGVSTCTAIQAVNDGRHTAEIGEWFLLMAGLLGGGFAAARIIGKKPPLWRIICGVIVGLLIMFAAGALSNTGFAFILGLVAMIAIAIAIAVYMFNSAT